MTVQKLALLYSTLNSPEQAYFEFIRDLVAAEKPKWVLEIGSGWGLSACAFLLESKANLVTIDKQGLNTLKTFKERVDLFDLWPRIRMITGDSVEVLKEKPQPPLDRQFDIVYVDGDHGYEGAKMDLELTWPKLKPGGVLFVGDDMDHYLNWATRDEKATKGEPEFGVAKAVLDFAMAREHQFEFWPVCNGFAVFEKELE